MTSTALAKQDPALAGGPEALATAQALDRLASTTIRTMTIDAVERAQPVTLGTASVAVEAAAPMGWDRYVGLTGEALAIGSFGASSPFAALKSKFGFAPANIYQAAYRKLVAAGRRQEEPSHV
jgi:hypothetical protein